MGHGRSVARNLALTGLAMAISGCATETRRVERIPPPPPPPPTDFRPFSPKGDASIRPSSPANATVQPRGSAPVQVIPSHRQYFDQRRKRYYFYDPARRAYFWEDGTPKG